MYRSERIQATVEVVKAYVSGNTVPVNELPRVIKAVDEAKALPGETLVYTISYRNASSEPLEAIVIDDATPTFTTFLSAACGTPLPASITGCTVTVEPTVGAPGAVQWTLDGVLNPGGEGTVEYQVTVDN